MSILNTTVKNQEEAERRCAKYGPLSKQWKSLKCSPLKKLESALSARFKQTYKSNASIDGNLLKERALDIVTHLGKTNFRLPIDGVERKRNIVYRPLPGESRSVDPETVEGWNSYQLLQGTECYDFCDRYNADEISFLNLQHSKTTKQRVLLLLACNVDGSHINWKV